MKYRLVRGGNSSPWVGKKTTLEVSQTLTHNALARRARLNCHLQLPEMTHNVCVELLGFTVWTDSVGIPLWERELLYSSAAVHQGGR